MTATLIPATAKPHAPEDRYVIPIAWTGAHVGVRLVEGFEILISLPIGGRNRSSGFWPRYSYDWEDLLAQQEQEIEEKKQQQHAQNRVRISPSVAEISKMEIALSWPASHLRSLPVLMRATNAVAFARALGMDHRWVVRRFGGKAHAWGQWHAQGCEIVAVNLIKQNRAVF